MSLGRNVDPIECGSDVQEDGGGGPGWPVAVPVMSNNSVLTCSGVQYQDSSKSSSGILFINTVQVRG